MFNKNKCREQFYDHFPNLFLLFQEEYIKNQCVLDLIESIKSW